MSIEEVIEKMNKKIEEVKESAAAKRPLIAQEDQQKLDSVLEKTVSVVNEAAKKVRETVNNLGDNADVDAFLERVQNKCSEACDYTISKISEFQENNDAKKKLDDVTKEIGDSFDELMANEDVKKVVDNVKNAVNVMRDSVNEFINKEETQANISKAKKAILHVADKAFDGLHSLLDEKENTETHDISVEEIHDEHNDQHE